MLDGRVLGASQVEYKPFGKLPLKRETLPPPECHSKTEAAEPASLQDQSRGPGALRNIHWTKAAICKHV